MPTYVYRFSEGDKDQKDLLGGKGANLAEMSRLGLPVPPGFTITTEACRAYMRDGVVPADLRVQVTLALREIEDALGRSERTGYWSPGWRAPSSASSRSNPVPSSSMWRSRPRTSFTVDSSSTCSSMNQWSNGIESISPSDCADR